MNCYGCVFDFRDPKLAFYILFKYMKNVSVSFTLVVAPVVNA